MKIEHIAMWTKDIERSKEFYTYYFEGVAGEKYINAQNNFESYFISFESGARLEIMQMPSITTNLNNIFEQYIGLIHIAFSVGSVDNVKSLTDTLRDKGYILVSEPHYTGDGYYESCILDPDGNRVEITE